MRSSCWQFKWVGLVQFIGLIALTSSMGCQGVQTGGEVDAGGPDCEETRIPIPGSQVTALGFSPDQVLAWAEGDHTTELTFGDLESDGMECSVAPSKTKVHASVEMDSTRFFFVDSKPKPGQKGMPFCESYLSLGATVQLASDDGALNEHIDAELTTAQSDRLFLSTDTPGDGFQGSYTVHRAGKDDAHQVNVRISQVFSSQGWLGRFSASITETSTSGGSSGSALVRPLAYWGSGDCSAGAVSVGVDHPMYATSERALSILAGTLVPLAFSDGTSSTVQISKAGDLLRCLVVDRSLAMESENSLMFSGPLKIETGDGRWSHQFNASVIASTSGGALERLRLSLNTSEVAQADFVETFGFTGVDFGKYLRARLSFGATYELSAETPATSGYFDVWASNEGVCSDCSPGTGVSLLSARVGG